MLYETGTIFRQIFVDGRKLPSDPQPASLGFSVGKWDRNSLIVETAGFNNRRGLDITGFPHSDALRIMERFHRIDFGHIEVEITIHDGRSQYFHQGNHYQNQPTPASRH
jgi:hypothetical protein